MPVLDTTVRIQALWRGHSSRTRWRRLGVLYGVEVNVGDCVYMGGKHALLPHEFSYDSHYCDWCGADVGDMHGFRCRFEQCDFDICHECHENGPEALWNVVH